MQQCKKITEQKELINENWANTAVSVKLLEQAYYELKDRGDEKLIGSSTACILVFDRTTNNLVSANLGDSGFVV